MISLAQTEGGYTRLFPERGPIGWWHFMNIYKIPRHLLGKKISLLVGPNQQWPVGSMVSLPVFYVSAVVFFCGNAAAEKQLAYVTVVSNIYLMYKPGRCVNHS